MHFRARNLSCRRRRNLFFCLFGSLLCRHLYRLRGGLFDFDLLVVLLRLRLHFRGLGQRLFRSRELGEFGAGLKLRRIGYGNLPLCFVASNRILLYANRLRDFANLRHSRFGSNQIARQASLGHLHNVWQRHQLSNCLRVNQQRTLYGLEGVGRVRWIRQNRLWTWVSKSFAGMCRGRRGLLWSALATAWTLLPLRTSSNLWQIDQMVLAAGTNHESLRGHPGKPIGEQQK